MNHLFYPEKIAVIGVSERENNLGKLIAENLFDFKFHGEIHLVGRHGGILFGRKILTSVQELPKDINVAVVLTPAVTVPEIVDQCGQKGIKWMIIETGGFREFSSEGASLEKKILENAQKWGIRFVGPNGIGIINMENGLCCPFVSLKGFASHSGRISILAQSGGVTLTYLHQLSSVNARPNKLVSMGNKLDLNEIDYLKYLEKDPNTDIIGLYLEGIENGNALMAFARKSSKIILLHKSNTGSASNRIAKFHTAALATDDRIVDAAAKQAGIVRVKNFRQFVHSAMIFTLPPMRGNNLVVISRSGGIAIVAADLAEEHGFNLVPFPEIFLKKVREVFRANVINPTNPLDLGDLFDFDLYTKILEYTIQRKDVDGILFQHGAISDTEKAASRRLIEAIYHLSEKYKKPIAFRYHTDDAELATVRQQFACPIFAEPEDAMEALAVSRDYYKRKHKDVIAAPRLSVDKKTVSRILGRKNTSSVQKTLLMEKEFKILEAYGIPVAPYQIVKTREEALKAVEALGFPVAIKVVTREPIHKTEAGAVILDIESPASLMESMDKFQASPTLSEIGTGYLIQKMIKKGTEIILGSKRDPSFGATVMVGMGGIFSEILDDVTLRIAPLTLTDATEMLEELKSYKLFEGFRGNPPLDKTALIQTILRLSRLLTDFPEIQQLDINPLKLFEKAQGCMAVDVRIGWAPKLPPVPHIPQSEM